MASVWIGEAWRDNERVERVVHKNEADCWEDITTLVADQDPDCIEVERETLHLGEDREWLIEM